MGAEIRGVTLDDAPDLLLPREVMAVTRLGKNSVYGAINRGDLKSVRLGPRQIRVPKQALREWIDPKITSSAPSEPANRPA